MARIVFDLDGTLVHSVPTITSAANAMLVEIGRAPVPEPVVLGFVGSGVRALVERLLEHTGGVPASGLAPHFTRYRALYEADPVTGTEPYPGVPAALARLAEAGHGLGVCTQKPNAPALAILRGLGLMPPVSALTGGDSLQVLKPDPRMFRHCADQLAPGPEMLVGDSETDAATAAAAGVPFLLHRRGYRHAPVEALPHLAAFDDFAELPGLVARMLDVRAPA